MKTTKDLFELVESIGELLQGGLHIIDNTPEYPEHEESKEFRVYHKSGICFDISKEVELENEETGEIEEWSYPLYNEWDGFDNKETLQELYNLLKEYGKVL